MRVLAPIRQACSGTLKWVFVGLLACAIPSYSKAQSPVCDATLQTPEEGLYGYRLPGDLCERLYTLPLSSTTLRLVSFTGSFEDYDLISGEPLQVTWAVPLNESVNLRAQGLKRRLYYRMDALLPGKQLSFEWPTTILAPLIIERDDIGMTAWYLKELDGSPRTIYAPVQVWQTVAPKTPNIFRLVVVPGRQLAEVYVSVVPVLDGKPSLQDLSAQALGYGQYSVDRGIEIPIERPALPGIYGVEVSADLVNGGAAALQFYFHNPPDDHASAAD
jgi:hypothetical protein